MGAVGAMVGQPRKPMPIGERHNMLTLHKDLGVEAGHSIGLFICDCGDVVVKRLANVRHGTVKSCGCIGRGKVARANKRGLTP